MINFVVKKIECVLQSLVVEGTVSGGGIKVGTILYAGQTPLKVKGIVLGRPLNTETVSLIFSIVDKPHFFVGQLLTSELKDTTQ